MKVLVEMDAGLGRKSIHVLKFFTINEFELYYTFDILSNSYNTNIILGQPLKERSYADIKSIENFIKLQNYTLLGFVDE